MDNESEIYVEIEEREFSFGPWLRASPLPKSTFELHNESSSGNCSENLFSPSSSRKCDSDSHRVTTEDVVE